MARPLRIELAGGYYHVMNRGNNRQDIFLTDKDRKAFVEALADSCEIYDAKLIAYVLMPNHFHLLVEADEYLLPLRRYIHLNPIRTYQFKNADLRTKVENLKKYPFKKSEPLPLSPYRKESERSPCRIMPHSAV